MTAASNRWFEYGEPLPDGDRVEAAIRTTYESDPDGPVREPDVERGTVSIEALDLLQEAPFEQHVRTDGRVWLSALPDDAEDELLETFERTSWDRLEELVRDHGLTPAQAVDYVAVEHRGLSQSEWARRRDTSQSNVSDRVGTARDQIDEREA